MSELQVEKHVEYILGLDKVLSCLPAVPAVIHAGFFVENGPSRVLALGASPTERCVVSSPIDLLKETQ